MAIEDKKQLFNSIYTRGLRENYNKAAYALTKLKSLLKFDTRWEYDGDGEPYLVDNENESPLYTVQWTGIESGVHPGYYSVEVEQDGEWDSTIYNFSDERSAYEKIEDIMRQSFALLERMCEAIETEERIQENTSNGFLACCYDPESYYEETNYVDKDGELKCNSSGCEVFATEEEAEEWADDNRPYGWVSFAMPAGCGPSLKEAIEDFPKSNRAMYRFAKRKHDDTKATRKYSGAPYFVHPESVAQIIQAYGGDKTLVNCGLAHDLVEDAGVTIEDLAEKFGKKVALIVDELTNDNREISKLGKEAYMSRKLENLSDEALFCKLADQLYNLLDHANESQAKRILKNLLFIKDRPKKGRIKDIYDDTLNTAFYVCSKF